VLKFKEANWSRNPEFGLFDTIPEARPELYKIVEQDITAGQKDQDKATCVFPVNTIVSLHV
jgi:hypothetical protein